MLGKRLRDEEANVNYQRAIYSQMPRGGAYANKRTRRTDTYLDRPLRSVPRARGANVTGEMKYVDSIYPAQPIAAPDTDWAACMADPTTTVDLGDGSAVLTPACLCAPRVGAGISNRIGKGIKILKVKIRYSIILPQQQAQSLADDPPVVRLILVQDMQTNAAQMDGDDLIQGSTTSETTVLAFQSVNNFGRFKVLKDRMVALRPAIPMYINTGSLVQTGVCYQGKMSYSWKEGLNVRFNAGSTGQVSDIIDNSLHMMAGANNILAGPRLSYYCRVCYKE